MSALSATAHWNYGFRAMSGKPARSPLTVVMLRFRTIAEPGDVCRVGRQMFNEGSSETPLARGKGVMGETSPWPVPHTKQRLLKITR
uniref:Uncharacterized protein n=1 Tax=uncultured Gemmatimonadales bacterium HF0770_11C06 TaxID=723616 RepID=E7C6Y9_9BACT|nr:hypothetical protein [uncultured Gemmatimonadales bacterium HF0770_11C06]